MIQTDINMLTAREAQLLDNSFQPGRNQRRWRGVLLSSAVFLLGLLAFGVLGFTAPWFAAVACMVLIVSATEKFTYQAEMAAYEKLIQKLVHRIEALEGVPPTAQEGIPSRSAQRPAPKLHHLAS
ncbi:MAG: hypothetical protein KC766_18135 [Myxococcales bacterium]|nr:hypothetical protein [Myxococcales bacterium]